MSRVPLLPGPPRPGAASPFSPPVVAVSTARTVLPARPTAGSAGRRAVGRQTAGFAGRPAGVADAAAVENQGVVEEGPAIYREQRLEIPLHLVGVVVAAELQPAGEAADVGVDRDPGPAEDIAGHDVGRMRREPPLSLGCHAS